jgi:hypothetical protein
MKYFFLLLAVCFVVNTSIAQKQYLDKSKTYSTAKIYQRGSNTLRVNNLVLTNDSLIQYSLNGYGSSNLKEVSTKNIRYVAVKNGTYAGTYAAIGGGFGLLCGLYGVLSVKADPTLDDSGVNWTPFIVGFTAGGAVIGVLLGATKAKWKMLYVPDKKTSYNFKLAPCFGKDYCGLGVRIIF